MIDCLSLYLNIFLYVFIPFAIFSCGYCTYYTETVPIFKGKNIHPYQRFRFGLCVVVFVLLAGLVWPFSVPAAVIAQYAAHNKRPVQVES